MKKKIKILLLIISLLISTTYTTYGYVGIDGWIPMMTEGSILTKELASVLEMECNTDVESDDKLTLTLKNGEWLNDNEVNESTFEKEFTRYNDELKIIKKSKNTVVCSVSGLKGNSKLKIPILCKGQREGNIFLKVTSEKKGKIYEDACVASVHNGEIEGSVGGSGEFQGHKKHNISGVLYTESFGSLPKGKVQITFELSNEFEFMDDGKIEYTHISNVKSDTKISDNRLVINLDFSQAIYERNDVFISFEKISIEAKEGAKSQDVMAKLYIDGNQVEEDRVGKYKAEVKEKIKEESKSERNSNSIKDKNKKESSNKKEYSNKKNNSSTKNKSTEDIIKEIKEAAKKESEFMEEIEKDKNKKESSSKKNNNSTKNKSTEDIIAEIKEAARKESEFMEKIEKDKRESNIRKNNNSTKRKGTESIVVGNKSKNIFADISSHWARGYIERLAKQNIISGFDDGKFKPEDHVTRAQVATILVKGLDIDLSTYENNKVFDDVETESWYGKFVYVCQRNNLINGFNGQFNPEREISGQELIQIVVNAYEKKYGQIKIGLEDIKNKEDVSSWAKVALAKGEKIGLTNNILDPLKYKEKAKRGQVATLIYELIR
ncbi:MAG: S-layer homology domain-containing protein [Anaeromicrobium sp.]|uniref:S-layer homology domain-containing protein n=1 Tax=Anaeromicrobium sp. TaxID=1929132 RepID=UPI0026011506|nr:S-layer homology domain-containing protein [Anaeromicrobium sp.]MCT4593659.1 S-layer homology domain-containing protein [Anaeromicrobium sp.]